MSWIKMRTELQTHPKIVRILSATKADKFRVIGGLHAVWSVFDQHSVDGKLFGYTPTLMNHVIGWDGFSEAMIAVGWLEFDGVETLVLPEFDEHNSKSAKRRAEDQKRKRDGRKEDDIPQDVRNESGQDADKKRTRERVREEKEEIQKKFDALWEAYPRKDSKAKALQAFSKIAPDEQLYAQILAGVKRAETSEQWCKDGGAFIPHASTWLNQRRWEDGGVSSANGSHDSDNPFA